MAKGRNSIALKIKNTAQTIFGVRVFRVLFFFYAFISFIFWFLNCFEVDWLYHFNSLFTGPYILVSKFYAPQGVSIDFTLAIIGGISLLSGFICDIIINILIHRLDDLEEEQQRQAELKRQREIERRRKKKAAKPSAVEINTSKKFEDSKLIFIIMPHVNKIKRKEADLELTFQEVEVWKQRVNKKLLENVINSKPMQKGYYRKSLFLLYKEFNYVDDFIYYLRPTLDSIILEFRKYGISVSYCYVLSALVLMQNLEKELDCMDTILSLNFINEIIVTNRFKITYDNKAIQKYAIKLKGEYNLSKNLAISNKQPLYELIDKKGEIAAV